MANRDYITVEELNFYINNVFLNEELLHNVPVVGEVSGVSYVNNHCYFTLKDEKAQIKCVFFSCPKETVPYNGAKVLVRGSVDFYAKGGQVTLKTYAIVNVGIGLLHEQLEKLRLKLEAAKRCGYNKAITFEFSHFMSPQSAYLQAGHLYDRYKEYFNL